MKKIKVLIASETYPPDVNGAARFTENLAKGLVSRGHSVVVIAPGTRFRDETSKENINLKVFRIASISLKPIHPYFRAVFPEGLYGKIKKIIKDFNPDIIHIQNHFLLGRTCLKIARENEIPIIGTNHFMPDNLLEYIPKIAHPYISKYMWSDFIKVYSQLDYVTVPSYTAASMLKRLGLKNQVKVISNGIDLKKFKNVRVSNRVYVKFKIRKDLFTFIFVGRLEKDKNIDLVLEASKLAIKKKPFQVIIVGKGADGEKLQRLSRELGLGREIIFTGEVNNSELNQLLSLAHAYIASGSAELQGIAVMEAMAHKLPILALNAVALPELVKDGVNGFLFKLDSNDLAKKMLKLLSLDSQKLKLMGKNSFGIIKLHSQEETLKKFEDLYKKVIGS